MHLAVIDQEEERGGGELFAHRRDVESSGGTEWRARFKIGEAERGLVKEAAVLNYADGAAGRVGVAQGSEDLVYRCGTFVCTDSRRECE